MQGLCTFFHKLFGHLVLQICSICILACLPAGRAWAATAPSEGADLSVYLLTIGPGGGIEQLFGHNALVIENDALGMGVAYNFGVFDFAEPNFVGRFIQGKLDYWLERWSAAATMEIYVHDDRSVWIHRLNLTPSQRWDLWQALETNALPGNRTYKYDYYTDNCSTRVRDALDCALGGELRRQLSPIRTGQTYRSHTRRLTQHDLPVYTGIDYVLGQRIDHELSAWEESFLPVQFMQYVRTMRVPDGSGAMVPLVKTERQTYSSKRFPEPQGVPVLWPGFLAAGLLLGGAFAALAWFAPRHWAFRWGFAVASAGWMAAVTVLGGLLMYGWLLTSHTAVRPNENALQINLLALPLAVLLPMLVTRRKRWPALTMWLAISLAGLALLGLLLKALPWFYQGNWEIIALALPAHAGLAVAAYLLVARGRRDLPASQPVTNRKSDES